MSNSAIIDHHELIFDAGDPLNGSLYLCLARGSAHEQAGPFVADMRAAGLWSDDPPKHVPDEHRDAYKEQLHFVEAVTYTAAAIELTIARFDHEKFPSDDQRWAAWKSQFDANYARV